MSKAAAAAAKKKKVAYFDSDSDSESNPKASRGSGHSADLENKSVQELEQYAASKAEETTEKVGDCLKIAEEIREDAARTLVTLHEQGEQIHRTHEMATKIDQDLSMMSTSIDDSFKKKKSHMEQREKLGLNSSPRNKDRQYDEPASAMDKVQVEKQKQDDSLDDLSGILGQLKGMAVDMGTELDSQNKALDALDGDVDELNNRVKGANQRARRLLNK